MSAKAEMCASPAHLYAHVPFCAKICPYCSFYKEASNRDEMARFIDAMLAELDARQTLLGARLQPRTIFFGGGTPSALSTPQLQRLLGGFSERLDLGELTEWTLEMNPATVSLDKARMLRAAGVNRVSMGVQSWEPALLMTLGRVHSAEQARRSFEILREAGFDNVNLDLIFGIPGQTRPQWERTLNTTVALAPEHVSAYNLTYEEDTEFFERFSRGEYAQDAEADAELFEFTADALAAAGYPPYEISNFSKPNRECAHNLAYWRGADYLGIGPSAFSTVGSRRWANVRNTKSYNDQMLGGKLPEDFVEHLESGTRRAEAIAFGLRTRDGVPANWLPGELTREHAALGLVDCTDGRVALTRRGRLLADAVAAEFM